MEDVRLDFLGLSAYTARVITDDATGGLAASTREVTARDVLEVPVAADSGFTVQLLLR